MKKVWVVAGISAVLACMQCQKEINEEFLIENDHIGRLMRTSKAAALETLFSKDSVVRDSGSIKLGGNRGRIRIYEKGGAPLLSLLPAHDSLGLIENIRVQDPRYLTREGVGLNSTFKDIKDHYTIRKIVTSMNNVIIFIKGHDMYFTIGREELPASLRFKSDVQIEEVQIPDEAKIKYLMVGWEQ